jgi:sRNA-binding carbon storage regulator CsrA
MLALSLKKNETATIVDAAGRYLGTVRVKEIRKSQIRLEFDMPPDIEVARESLVCDCDEYDHVHPIWWCCPHMCNG